MRKITGGKRELRMIIIKVMVINKSTLRRL